MVDPVGYFPTKCCRPHEPGSCIPGVGVGAFCRFRFLADSVRQESGQKQPWLCFHVDICDLSDKLTCMSAHAETLTDFLRQPKSILKKLGQGGCCASQAW